MKMSWKQLAALTFLYNWDRQNMVRRSAGPILLASFYSCLVDPKRLSYKYFLIYLKVKKKSPG
jgi:hypothetical protein